MIAAWSHLDGAPVQEDEISIAVPGQPLRGACCGRTLSMPSKNSRRMRPCDGSSKLRHGNARPKPVPWRWVPLASVFHWWVKRRRPRRQTPMSRRTATCRPINASFSVKRKWPTSVSPRSISSTGKTSAAVCSWPAVAAVAMAVAAATVAAAAEVAASALAAGVAEAAEVAAAARSAAAGSGSSPALLAWVAQAVPAAACHGDRAVCASAGSDRRPD